MTSGRSRILVTGGAGYIGSHVVKELRDDGFEVVVYDNLSTGYAWAVSDVDLIEADLANTTALSEAFRRYEIDTVLHFAGSIDVAESVRNPIKYHQNNIANMLNLLEVCARFEAQRFVFSSSCAVYGVPKEIPIKEGALLAPVSPYAASKAAGERALMDLAQISNLRFVILRYFNVAGADASGTLGECHEPETHLIPLACRAALNQHSELSVYGNDYQTKDGTCIRDYIHVTDLARAHIGALEFLGRKAMSEIFNCGYGTGYSVNEIVDTVKRISGVDFATVIKPRRSGDVPELVAANDKIINQLRWQPQHDNLDEIVRSALDWEKRRTNIMTREARVDATPAGSN